MKITEIITESLRTENPCWKGYKPVGTKKKNGKTVPNCVPTESLNEFAPGNGDDREPDEEEILRRLAARWWLGNEQQMAQAQRTLATMGWEIGPDESGDDDAGVYVYRIGDDDGRDTIAFGHSDLELNEDWQKANRRDKTNGMSRKAVKAYRRENPGSKLKTAVTTKPSKLKPGSKAAKRRKSFCARMSGNKGPMKKPNGKPTPKALALRRWNCESVEQMVDLILENMDHDKDNQAVPELKAALLAKKSQLRQATDEQVYDIIDSIMTRIAKSHGISGQKLHDMWVAEYDQIPDTWIMK